MKCFHTCQVQFIEIPKEPWPVLILYVSDAYRNHFASQMPTTANTTSKAPSKPFAAASKAPLSSSSSKQTDSAKAPTPSKSTNDAQKASLRPAAATTSVQTTARPAAKVSAPSFKPQSSAPARQVSSVVSAGKPTVPSGPKKADKSTAQSTGQATEAEAAEIKIATMKESEKKSRALLCR